VPKSEFVKDLDKPALFMFMQEQQSDLKAASQRPAGQTGLDEFSGGDDDDKSDDEEPAGTVIVKPVGEAFKLDSTSQNGNRVTLPSSVLVSQADDVSRTNPWKPVEPASKASDKIAELGEKLKANGKKGKGKKASEAEAGLAEAWNSDKVKTEF
jgi:hypothetical protein